MRVIVICSNCSGRGRVKKKIFLFSYKRKCPACKGRGRITRNMDKNKVT